MDKLLSFDKPKRAKAEFAGKYVPNMSAKSRRTWKAKLIKGDDPRIEIRKEVTGFDPVLAKKQTNMWGGSYIKQSSLDKNNCSAQILIIVRPDGSVVMSANGRMAFDYTTWFETHVAVEEALAELTK